MTRIPPPNIDTVPDLDIFDHEFVAGETLYHGKRGYTLKSLIGRGGMAQVWLAKDIEYSYLEKQDMLCAVKLLPSQLLRDKLAVAQLKREAMKTVQIQHDYVVQVYDWGVDEALETPFIIMEYLQGKDFGEVLLDEGTEDTGGLPFSRVLELLEPICTALDHIWKSHTMVHRDIKRNNLLLTNQGVVKVLDFGIAAQTKHTATIVGLTKAARTPGSSAPELKARITALPNQDVFSLGSLAYELLTSEQPYIEDPDSTSQPMLIESLNQAETSEHMLQRVNEIIFKALSAVAGDRQDDSMIFFAELAGVVRETINETETAPIVEEKKHAEKIEAELEPIEELNDFIQWAEEQGISADVVPRDPQRLYKLTELRIDSEKINYLPSSIGALCKLKLLEISNNGREGKLSNLPHSIGKLNGLRTLKLNGNQLNRLPESFSKLKNLISLNLNSNKLENLSESFCKLTNLRVLYLYSNQLKDLPESFSKLPNLIVLNLDSNQLTSLPYCVSELTSLKWLNLTSNFIRELPDNIAQLTSLKTLYLGSNELCSLPESLCELKAITIFSLNSNKLKRLPEGLGQLKNLRKLDINLNLLIELPASLRKSKFSNVICGFNNQIFAETQVLKSGQNGLSDTDSAGNGNTATENKDQGFFSKLGKILK